MQNYPVEEAIYQYPDPDDLNDATRFAWAGDDNDYIPEALRQTLSSKWPASEANHGDHVHSPLRHVHHQRRGKASDQERDDAIEADYDRMDLDLNDEEVIADGQLGYSQVPDLNSPRIAGGSLSNQQLRIRHSSNSRGRKAQRGGLGRGHRGIKRGLRNPVEPEPEFKLLHSQATMAFIANDYDEAETLTLQALQINPEMYPAHSLLSQIHAARGDLDKAITAAYSGAHTQPRNVEMWSRIARMVLDRDNQHTVATLRDALYCYNRVISIDKSNVEVRFQRAALNRELGKIKHVVTEYEQLAKYLPHDTTVLRDLAQASIEVNEPDRALRLYKAAIAHFQDLEPLDPVSFTWSDVNVLVELCLFCQKYEEGLGLTKSLSRWLLGRRDERCWENFTEDDREWDIDDLPRRVELPDFIPDQYDLKSYGTGLPLDLRIKLGILRLNLNNIDEAINHFEWLDPADSEIGAKVFDYPDLFRDVARPLMGKGLHEDAIRFYEPLQQVVDHVDDAYSSELAQCYKSVGRNNEAEALQASIQDFEVDDSDEDYGEGDEDHGEGNSNEFEKEPRKSFITAPTSTAKRYKKKPEKEKENLDYLLELFIERQALKNPAPNDQGHTELEWPNLTERLVQRFMQEKAFYPEVRNDRSIGHAQQARYRYTVKKTPQEKMDSHSRIGQKTNSASLPSAFAGIAFDEWLEIFLEYGLSLAHRGDLRQAYEVMYSASQANVFDNVPDSLFLIHVCWFTCALLNNDNETLCSVCRWFMKDCQFVPDAYRLFSALNKLCDGDISWFNNGPSQKHILRQIKAMDFALAGDARVRNSHHEKSGYTAKDDEGNIVLPQNMDVSLLMLYGHLLYAGRSYVYANNYFLRALSVDPTNSMIKLTLGLGYIHHGFKRQADNRHQLLMQGFGFLFEYYNHRHQEGGASEQQEAAYNIARAFHLLGLTHLAAPYYEQCLNLSKSVQAGYRDVIVEDFAQEAAFALQGIWATNGNEENAFEVTEQWLQM